MLRRFFYNARTRGPSLARDIIFLVKPDHQEWRRAAKQVGIYCRRKADGPARLGSGERVVQLVLRPVRPRIRSATLRSAPTECDDLWRPASLSTVLVGWRN